MEDQMTDKQAEILMNLIVDKFDKCQTMDEVKEAVEWVREIAKKET